MKRGRKVTPFGVGPNGEPTKVCYKCKTAKSLTEFAKDRSRADGYNSGCKECSKKKQEEYRKLDYVKEAHNAASKKYFEENKDKVREYQVKHREDTREVINAKAKIWRESEKGKTYIDKYRQENRDKLLETSKEYYWANKDERNAVNREYRQVHSEELNAKSREWRVLNPESVRYYANAKYAKLKLSRMSGKKNIRRRIEIKDNHCFYCGEIKEVMEDDHYYPLSRGGSNHWWNIVRSCMDCNRAKHDKLVSEWVRL